MIADMQRRSGIPYRLLAVVLVIAGLGVLNISSAARATFPNIWMSQLLWLGIGLCICCSNLLFDYRALERIAYPLYAFTCFLLIVVLVAGKKVYGARRWIDLGIGSFQPSELTKIATIFIVARYFAEERRDRGYTIRDLIRPLNVSRPAALLAGLFFFWGKADWLRDPIGEVARRAYQVFDGQPPEWESSFLFRTLIVTATLLYLVIFGYLFSQRPTEPRGFQEVSSWRRRLGLTLWLGPPAVITTLSFFFWRSEFLGDPKATVLAWLIAAGGAQGSHAVLEPVLWFRILLLLALIVYLFAAIFVLLKKGHQELSDWLAPLDLVALPMILIMAQPDLGTALIVGAISFSLILFCGMRLVSILLLGATGVGLSVLAWFALLKDYQKRRVLTFLDPEADALGSGYHANQSIIAVGSGRWFGKGFNAGTQTQLSFLPEQHTDFAFSVWSEEHGFAGGIALILLYFALVVIAVGIAAAARDKFGALMVTGFTALIFWHTFVNMGMVIGLLPIVGVPLPLFSYGGSALLTVMLGLGITMNVAYRRHSF